MKRAPTLTKRQRRELDQVPPQRLQRPRTLTRMVAPAPPPPPQLAEGWKRCTNCKAELLVSGLFVCQLLEPAFVSNDADEIVPNPDAGKVAMVDGVQIIGHLCAFCQAPIWPE